MGIARKYNRTRTMGHGSSLIEMVLAVPLLAMVISLTFFFGWSMVNKQKVQSSGRYVSWRRVRARQLADEDYVNTEFFAGRGEAVGISHGLGPTDTLSELVSYTAQGGAAAQQLAGSVIWGRCPRGERAQVAARFPSSVSLWERYEGRIESDHFRDGHQWRRIDNVNCHREIRDGFLDELDTALDQLESTGSDLSAVVRAMYLSRWGPWRP